MDMEHHMYKTMDAQATSLGGARTSTTWRALRNGKTPAWRRNRQWRCHVQRLWLQRPPRETSSITPRADVVEVLLHTSKLLSKWQAELGGTHHHRCCAHCDDKTHRRHHASGGLGNRHEVQHAHVARPCCRSGPRRCNWFWFPQCKLSRRRLKRKRGAT